MLMLIVTATATMSAQDELEQTLDPVIIIEEPIDGEVNILVVCDEPATIYVSIDGGEVGYGEHYMATERSGSGDYGFSLCYCRRKSSIQHSLFPMLHSSSTTTHLSALY